MPNTVSFSSSKFRLHNGGMSSSDVIRKKRENQINKTVRDNNNITMRNNKIVSVNSYSTYMELTRPKYVGVYSKEILSGHNFYKTINKNGTIHEREECVSDNCMLGTETQTSSYLEVPVNLQTNIDMSFNAALESAMEGSNFNV